jgi:hypothetical protein
MSGVFGGGSATTDRKNQLAAFGNLADTMYFGQYGPAKGDITGAGTGLGTAQNFFQSLLQGGGTQVLAPQISQIQQQAGQQRATTAQFQGRSGGTAAYNQMIDVNTQGQIDNLIASLTGTGAAGLVSASQALGNLGLGTLQTGVTAAGELGQLSGASYEAAKARQQANIGAAISLATLGVGGAMGLGPSGTTGLQGILSGITGMA